MHMDRKVLMNQQVILVLLPSSDPTQRVQRFVLDKHDDEGQGLVKVSGKYV